MSNYVMTFSQYREYERGEKTLKEIKRERRELQKIDDMIGKIMGNSRLKKMLVFTVAGLNYASTVLADTGQAVANIDDAGGTFLGIIQSIGYWLCLIGCMMEILKSVLNGTSKDIGKIIIKYLMIFAALYFMPWAFDLIKEIFSKKV